jgi:hypothetical protein
MAVVQNGRLRQPRFSAAIVALWRWGIIAALGAYVTFVALRAVNESWNNDSFPEALAIKLENLPLVFPVHMVTGGLALMLVPLTLSLRGTRWHKLAGRITAADVVIAGVTAIPVALDLPVTKISAAGFAAQGVVWMVLLGVGIWHIHHGNVTSHRACMLMMAAVTSGVLFFRLYLGLWKFFGVPEYFCSFYAFDAWIAWGLPLVVMSIWVWCRRLG